MHDQGATKALSDSPGLVEWFVGLASLDHGLPDGQAIFLWQTSEMSVKQAVREGKKNSKKIFLSWNDKEI